MEWIFHKKQNKTKTNMGLGVSNVISSLNPLSHNMFKLAPWMHMLCFEEGTIFFFWLITFVVRSQLTLLYKKLQIIYKTKERLKLVVKISHFLYLVKAGLPSLIQKRANEYTRYLSADARNRMIIWKRILLWITLNTPTSRHVAQTIPLHTNRLY